MQIFRSANSLKDVAAGGGNLTARLKVESQDEVGELAAAFNEFMDKLHPLMTDIHRSASTVQSAVSEDINLNLVAIQQIVNNITDTLQYAETISAKLSQSGTEINDLIGNFKL